MDISPQSDAGMKLKVARTLKWNVVDKFGSQLLYLVTGIVLANVLSKTDFGLAGAVMVFQSFATLLVDSGFSYALIQKKNPSDTDYSTVLWFNMGMAICIYAIMYVAAPLVAMCFENDARLVPLTRVMFLALVLNAASIVQANRLMKLMDVRMVAVANSVGLFAGAVTGIAMAIYGFGAWAIVWQTIVMAAMRSAVLWGCTGWTPKACFSMDSLKSIFHVGAGIMGTSFLNVVFQNIYQFLIGYRSGLVSLGYYTQADKWSKMPVASLSAVFTSSFLPALSQYQDDGRRFASATAKMNRLTAYLLFPALGLLIVMATPIFHALFGMKWDGAIPLFRLLLLRGIFTVLGAVYNNYIVALGRSRLMIYTELLRDGTAIAAILLTLPYMALTLPENPTYGLVIFVSGQVVASAICWLVTLFIAARLSGRKWVEYITDIVPYVAMTGLICAGVWYLSRFISNPWLLCAAQGLAGIAVYMAMNYVLGSKIQHDAIEYVTYRFRKNNPSTDSAAEGDE
ncbi:MAG: lipopolysaccharide biosynthesis protein [Muribaculaceae bacterium]|nr:lipopolysaccharide biosynthesis protein [Muribaculaceae bacterium]